MKYSFSKISDGEIYTYNHIYIYTDYIHICIYIYIYFFFSTNMEHLGVAEESLRTFAGDIVYTL